jgi:hypothetical protein
MMRITTIFFCFFCFCSQLFGQENTEKTIFEPTPNWVKKYPKPTLKKEYKNNLNYLLIHDESQYNHITGENYRRSFYYVYKEEGIEELSGINVYYEPDYQTLHLHKVIIHRLNQSIALKDNLHTKTILFEDKIGADRYGDDVKCTVYLDRLEMGDLVEFAYTKKGKQPDLHNWLTYRAELEGNDFIGTNYLRILNYSTESIYYTLLNTDTKPTIQKQGDYNVFELITTCEKTRKEELEKWFIPYKKVYVTDKTNWRDVVAINLKNHQLDIPPPKLVQDKVKLLTKGITEKEQQINAVFDFIQRDIEYLEYGLIDPKRPEVTLKKGHGDCKSKSLLTIKMLECIGVASYPVIVDSKGIDDRLISSHAFIFDHEIIEFIYKGDTISFDATMDFKEGSTYKRYVNDFRYGLRMIKGTNHLTRFPNPQDGRIFYNETIKIKRNYFDKLEYDSDKEIDFMDGLAQKFHLAYKDLGLKKMWSEVLKDYYSNSWCSNSGTRSDKYDADKLTFTLSFEQEKCNETHYYGDDDILKIYPNLLKSWWLNFDVQKSSLLFEVLPFQDVTFNYKIILPDSIHYNKRPVIITNDWLEYRQIIEQKGDTIYATYDIKVLKPYLPHARFEEVKTVIDEIQNDMSVYIDKKYLEQEPKWKDPEHLKSFLISIGFLSFIIIMLWLNFRTLRRRKKKIKALENEVEMLKEQLQKSS